MNEFEPMNLQPTLDKIKFEHKIWQNNTKRILFDFIESKIPKDDLNSLNELSRIRNEELKDED